MKSIKGFRLLIIQSPCPVGWRYDPAKTIEIARAGVQSGLWPLYEILNGTTFKLNYKPRELRPVTEYLKPQARFRHMTEEEIADVQENASTTWAKMLQADEIGKLIV
jgi:pyruvate/2-oxoacid:ferredoxin oxidoreductase beta subunit